MPALDPPAVAVADAFCASVGARRAFNDPYAWWMVDHAMPADVRRALNELPLPAPALDGLSGKRELHNDTRAYFAGETMARFPVMGAVARALQSPRVARAITEAFAAPIEGTYLRLEYAQDIDGFWLQPHTDLGVKKFTFLLYLSEGQDDLGTDIYRSEREHFGRPPFTPNSAMVFVPGDATWHGFEKRRIAGVRKSVILNYVTDEWRAKDQLSFPDEPVRLEG